MVKILLLLFLLSTTFAGAAEFYVSPTPTPTTNGIRMAFDVGTINNPYDASTVDRFDAVMSIMPPSAVVHLQAGIYFSRGQQGWGPKSFQQIIGAGIDATIIKFPPDLVANGKMNGNWILAPQSPYRQTNILVSDLTLDCNYQTGAMVILNGIDLHGSGNTIRRVKLINSSAFTVIGYGEAWGITIAAFPFQTAENNRIEDCIVSGFTCNGINNITAMGLLENNSGFITGNYLVQTTTNHMFGITPGSHDTLVTGNILEGLTIGSHFDTLAGVTNDIISGNLFIRCSSAIDWDGGNFCDSSIINNIITITNDETGYASTTAIFLHAGSTFRNLIIGGNRVTVAGNFPNQKFIYAPGSVTGLQVRNNSVATNLPSIFSGASTGVTFSQNYEPSGNVYTNY